MKTVLEIIKGLAVNGNGGRNNKGTVAFVTMLDDTNFITQYLIAQLKAEKIRFVSETENTETFAVSGGSTLTIKNNGKTEMLGGIYDNYTVTYRTTRGGVYIVHATSKDTKATAEVTQAPSVETPAVKNENKTQYSAENIIADFENDAQGFLNQIPKLIDAGTLSAPVFEATTFTSQKFTYDLKGYKEDIKLIVRTGLQFKTPRSSKGEKVASIEFTFGENATAENLKSRTVALRIV